MLTTLLFDLFRNFTRWRQIVRKLHDELDNLNGRCHINKLLSTSNVVHATCHGCNVCTINSHFQYFTSKRCQWDIHSRVGKINIWRKLSLNGKVKEWMNRERVCGVGVMMKNIEKLKEKWFQQKHPLTKAFAAAAATVSASHSERVYYRQIDMPWHTAL